MTGDMWHMTVDMWHMTCDIRQVKNDMWHVTCDMWNVTNGGGWTFSKNVSTLAPMVCTRLSFEHLEEKDHSLN